VVIAFYPLFSVFINSFTDRVFASSEPTNYVGLQNYKTLLSISIKQLEPVIDPATGQLVKGLEPYTLQTCGDITLGIIGLTAVMRNYATFFKLHLREPAVILPDLITEVRDHGAQTIVLLSHLGSKQDIALAEQIEGLDVIIGAHDHVELSPPLVVNRTIIAQAGDFGRFLGRLDLELDSYTGKVCTIRACVPIIDGCR
jgi:2',3'-cyclic-nucleotide 2'-phosphodiesterase (5'-nucleotidase family)